MFTSLFLAINTIKNYVVKSAKIVYHVGKDELWICGRFYDFTPCGSPNGVTRFSKSSLLLSIGENFFFPAGNLTGNIEEEIRCALAKLPNHSLLIITLKN